MGCGGFEATKAVEESVSWDLFAEGFRCSRCGCGGDCEVGGEGEVVEYVIYIL